LLIYGAWWSGDMTI